MIHLLWSLLNVALFFLVIFLCYKATRTVRNKYGYLASFVFALLLIGILALPGRDKKKGADMRDLTNGTQVSVSEIIPMEIILKKEMLLQYKLDITCGTDKNTGVKVPLHGFALTTGLVAGTTWKTLNIIIIPGQDKKYGYHVSGQMDWKLLGITVYSEGKSFAGSFSLP